MMKSKITKKYSRLTTIFTLLHILCMFLPIAIYLPQCISIGANTDGGNGNVVILTLSAITCVILLLISIVVDATHRLSLHKSVIWVVLLGMTITLTTAVEFIIMMAITSLLDELLIYPLRKSFKNKVIINKEIDKRVP